MSDTTNRLAHETSPYLLQHARNPVDWYPWGPEAFEEARRRGVPIFLSIGYSTCYWCHVMERESFEDEQIAAVMNERFVNVKVDREELPSVDDVYMAATQIMTGRGGWPMSVFLEPGSLRPFWAGTYFPREPRGGMPSFRQVLGGMSNAWQEQRDEVLEQSRRLAEAVGQHLGEAAAPVTVGEKHVSAAISSLLQLFDEREGGFGGAPKFPQPIYLEFLLDARQVAADEASGSAMDHAIRRTLDRMAAGGLHDHAGGGFHRYCVDGSWTVPHFEKMLYDNAQLAMVYARAASAYKDPWYRRVLRRTLDYVLAEMTGEHGGFFSAQDAEVDGREGLNYLWTADEVRGVLVGDELRLALAVYGLDAGANFTDPHHPEDGPKNVLRLEGRPDEIAPRYGVSAEELIAALTAVNERLYRARAQRKQPHTDDKVLAAWNGMMVAAMAEGGVLLGDDRYLRAAERGAGFLLTELRRADGRLARSWRAGRASRGAVLEDYAYAVQGLVALHRAGRGSGAYLAEAKSIAETARRLLGDPERGGHFDTEADRPDLFVRARTTYDGAVPSGAGVMLNNLIDLHELDPAGPWLDRAIATLGSLSGAIATQGVSSINSTRGLLRLLQMDDDTVARLDFGEPSPEPTTPAESRAATPVEIYASAERVRVTEDGPAVVDLVLKIDEPYHILAAEPAGEGGEVPAGLTPLRVGLVSGQGVAVYADYPEGVPYGAAFAPDELRVHTGELELRVVLERAEGVGAGRGDPILGVTFQACTDTECLRPTTLELDVAIDLD